MTIVTLISSYPKLKMLTNIGKIEFKDGVAKVEFKDEKEASAFKKNLLSNASLQAYVRIADDKQAAVVAQLNQAASNQGGIKVGAQTSEVKEDKAEASKPSAANLFALAQPKA